jgi:hypothetical protein
MEKQTAVDFLKQKLYSEDRITYKTLQEAEAMFEEQIIDAHIAGFYSEPFGKSRTGEAKHYYKITFKSE